MISLIVKLQDSRLKDHVLQMVRFASVGVLNTVLTLLAIFLFYRVGLGYILANWLGYLLGFINSFVLNKIWTFKSSGNLVRESVLFVLVFGVCYLFQLLALLICTDLLGLGLVVSQLLAMCVYTGLNFLGNKFITFRTGAAR